MRDIVKFSILLVLEIPAVFISILIFKYFITHRVDRLKPKNHVWLILLTLNFLQLLINLPMVMHYYYRGRVWPATDSFCIWWSWFEYSSASISLILMAWASIERHFFIFYPRLLLGAWWKKWIYHFGPILFCILWPPSWYILVIIIRPSCINAWDYNQAVCGMPCYTSTNGGIYGIFELMFSIVIPLSIIIFSNIALISRVIYEKIARHQVVNWSRHRKMVFHLWFISSLYLTAWLPLTLTELIRITTVPSFLDDRLATIFFLLYFLPLLIPFVCLGVFPEITDSIRRAIRQPGRNRIGTVRVTQTQL